MFLFLDVNCRELFVNFFFLTANFANFTNWLAQVNFGLITRIAYAGRPGSAGFGWLACDFCGREVVRLILEFAVSKSF